MNKRVHRLGLAFDNGIEAEGIEAALEKGVNYLFWLNTNKSATREVVKAALKRDRKRYVFAGGASLGFFAGSLRRAAERLLRSFELEYIDVFQLYWLGKMAALTKSVEQELVSLREEGLVRAIGVSIHDRKHAAKLAVESPLDLLMVRYIAAHPGAETDPLAGDNRASGITHIPGLRRPDTPSALSPHIGVAQSNYFQGC